MSSCLLIAGEKSGEEHAMTFFPELKRLTPAVEFFGVGGDDLKDQGMELIYHLEDFSSMGFSEVIHKIPFYFRALHNLEREVIKRETKTAILIDFQDFNLRLAGRLKKLGVNVLYYVAPQAWVWKPHRAALLSKYVHTLFTILPFEKGWFQERGVKHIRGIPHPLMLTYVEELGHIPEKPFGSWKEKVKLLLLPGSRKFEVYSLLPEFIRAVKILKKSLGIEVHVVTVPHVRRDFYELYSEDIDIFHKSENLPNALRECHMAFAASGTVTLSTGLFELPTIVCYKTGLLNEFIYDNFIKYHGPVSLTNIVHHKWIFPELLQSAVEPVKLARIIRAWTSDEKLYNEVKSTLKKTKYLLSGEDFSVPHYMAKVIDG